MAGALLRLERVRVDFPETVAVNGMALSVGAGEVCGLIGPNGSGKTTTLRTAAGLQRPHFGRVRVHGEDPATSPRTRGRIGFMPDAGPLDSRLTVDAFLHHFACGHGLPDPDHRVAEVLALVDLTAKASVACHNLSRGMKQRLYLARTLLVDPDLLLLDEPASGIDPIGRLELRKLIRELGRMGKGVLVSSHVLSEMDEFCTSVAIMERGRLVRSGGVQELIAGQTVHRMFLRWRRGRDAVAAVLQNHANVHELRISDGEAEFRFDGSDDALDAVLADLVNRSVSVAEWRPVHPSLESILIESGARTLS